MGNTRREFTPEYKDEAVKLVINTGRAVAVVARELGIKEQSLGRGSTPSRPGRRPVTGPCRKRSGSSWPASGRKYRI